MPPIPWAAFAEFVQWLLLGVLFFVVTSEKR